MSNTENKDRRFIGKVKEKEGQFGKFWSIVIDNPMPVKKDNTPDQYYKGSLVWLDEATGKKFFIKGMSLRGVTKQSLEAGFVQSVSIDLDNLYEAEEIK